VASARRLVALALPGSARSAPSSCAIAMSYWRAERRLGLADEPRGLLGR
jgi:hypothetical protein